MYVSPHLAQRLFLPIPSSISASPAGTSAALVSGVFLSLGISIVTWWTPLLKLLSLETTQKNATRDSPTDTLRSGNPTCYVCQYPLFYPCLCHHPHKPSRDAMSLYNQPTSDCNTSAVRVILLAGSEPCSSQTHPGFCYILPTMASVWKIPSL